ncbi:CHAT domain-containing protein [Azospirillum baldaniorum]|nr:CHAT domain-containing protein [Azospirillum baldaniorum]
MRCTAPWLGRLALPVLLLLSAPALAASCPDSNWWTAYKARMGGAAPAPVGGVSQPSPRHPACDEAADRLRGALWSAPASSGWPGWSEAALACASELDSRDRRLLAAAAAFDSIRAGCPPASVDALKASADTNRDRKAGFPDDTDAAFTVLLGIRSARAVERAGPAGSADDMASARMGFREALETRYRCATDGCRINVAFAKAHACLYLARMENVAGPTAVGPGTAEACAAAQMRPLATLMDPVELNRATQRFLAANQPAAGADDGPLERLASLRTRADALAAAGKEEQARRALAYARELVAENRLAFVGDGAESDPRFRSLLDAVYDRSARLAVDGRSGVAGMPEVLRILEDRRRIDLVRAFRSDCWFEPVPSPTSRRTTVWAANAALRGDWIVVVSNIGGEVLTAAGAADSPSDLFDNGVTLLHRTPSLPVEEAVRDWRKGLDAEDAPPSLETIAANLSQTLFGPVAQGLLRAKPKRIIIVPDAWAARIPFSALPFGDRNTTIADAADLVVMPALDARLWPKEKALNKPPPRVLAGGLTERLTHSASEIRRIATLLDSVVLNETELTLRNLEAAARDRFDVLHIATHASFGGAGGPSIAMGDGTTAGAADIETLVRMMRDPSGNALDLLTLSACETALGDGSGGKELGLLGMALRTGVRASVGTLWTVNKESTPELMTRFYEYMTMGCDKARALRLAQLDLKQGRVGHGAWRSPHHWAGFVFSGDWTALVDAPNCPLQ